MKITARIVVLLLASMAGAACSTTRAATPVERPVLDVPPVPHRIVEPVPLPEPEKPAPVADLPPAPPAGGNARQKPAATTAKPDPKAEAPPAEPPATAPAPPTVPPLRTIGTPDAREATRRIGEIIARAQEILDNTHYQPLSDERRGLYRNAQLLISQTKDAISNSNFEFATNLAEKAERLARELSGRLR
jgi:hypothetical protein